MRRLARWLRALAAWCDPAAEREREATLLTGRIALSLWTEESRRWNGLGPVQ